MLWWRLCGKVSCCKHGVVVVVVVVVILNIISND